MTEHRRVWAARAAVVVAGAAIVGSSSMSMASTAAEPPTTQPPSTSAARISADPIAGAAQTVRVTIPPVMIGQLTRTADGSLAVPVLIAAGGPPGLAYLDPPTPGCSWRLVPGEVARVHCAVADRNRERALVVVLDDGRTFARRL